MSPSSPPRIKASDSLETPEILGLIARNLPLKDLAQCAQVSRLWNAVFQPRLWHTFDDTIEPWRNILEMASRTSQDRSALDRDRYYTSPADNRGRDEAWVRSVIGKNAKHIRRLIVRWPLSLEACVQSGECVNVTLFKTSILPDGNRADEVIPFVAPWERFVPDVPASFFVTENNPEGTLEDWYHPFNARALRFMWQFILQNPGLEELTVGLLWTTEGLSFLPPKPFLHKVLQFLTRLRRLDSLPLDNDDFALLPTLTPKMEYFRPGRCSFFFHTGYIGESVREMGIGTLKDVYTHMKVIKFRASISAKHQAKILECMPELTELHVGRESVGSETTNWNEKLHINADTLRLWSVTHLYCLLHPTITHSTKNLQELRIQMVNYGVNGLVEVLRRVNSNLQVLDLDSFVPYPLEEWYRNVALPLPPALDLQGTLPQFNLRSLRLSGLCSPHVLFAPARHRDEEIVEQSEDLAAGSVWWGCFPNLVEFVTQFVAPATLIGIVDNCPQIGILDVSLAQKGSSAVAYVLTKCSKLKSFVGKGHMVDATQVVEGPAWVCRDIEHLHLEVQGIPRTGGAANGQVRKESLVFDISKARELSIGVYERIGQLTKLRELDLGGYTHLPERLEHTMVGGYRSFESTFEWVNHVHPFLNNSLELSLASGLDRLAGLKNLRQIGVQEVDLCIGQEELEWMKEHWPRLESWIGLEPYLNKPGDYSAKNEQIAKLIQRKWPVVRLDDWVWTRGQQQSNF